MRKSALVLGSLVVLAGVVVACGAERRSAFDPDSTADKDAGFEGGSTGFTPGQTPCEGLECKIVECDDGEKTTLRGKVYDPAGSNPLYNVTVYIPGGNEPDADLPPIPSSLDDGITCETCSSVVLNPLVSALTDGKGEFVLENVPVDKDVPVIVQIGKWRRKFQIDITKKCEPNDVKDRTFKLPASSKEGDLPHFAVTSGSNDALECLLRGIGIDDSEFVNGHSDAGHVHMFSGSGGKMGPSAQNELWNDVEQLKKYDIVLLNCEGSESLSNKGGSTPGARGAMYEYLNMGGRVFGTHYQHVWFSKSPESEFQELASWADAYPPDDTFDVNMSFPKGEQMAEWLQETGASTTLGKIPLKAVRGSVADVREPAVPWIIKDGQPGAKFFTVNTPISAPTEEQCGRGVFSDLHITDRAGPSSISGCDISKGGLNGQQKILEFILFDLSACVSDDKVAPQPPK